MTEPASGLKRLLDYKLLFDCLADEKSGKISVHTLSARWPKESESQDTKLPCGCIDEWKATADKDCYLDWEAFSSALAVALKKDQPRMSKLPSQIRSEDSHRGLENCSIGKSLILNPVKSADIEGFLAECEGQSLVKALARMKKEVYSCQSALQQQKSNVVKGKNKVQAEEKDGVEQQMKDKPSGNGSAEKTKFMLEDTGNEKEELLKGIEILKQTQQWFQHRVDQLKLEGSNTKKPSAEELLAIMEGSSVHPAAQTLHHIQKINAHLSSLALHAPVLSSSSYHQPRRSSTALREERQAQRLMSEPGPGKSASRTHRIHRPTATAPPQIFVPASAETGARVIGIDIPTHSGTQDFLKMPDRFGRQTPRRAHSFQEIRASHPSEGRLKQTSKRSISSPDKNESDKRSKPRRSHSFSQISGEEAQGTVNSGTKMEYSTSLPRTQGYPLRETVSLNQLPNGGVAYGYSSYGSASQRMSSGQNPNSGTQDSSLGHSTSLRSSSMMTLPSRDSQVNQEQKIKKKGSGSFQKKLEKEELRARQVAAHQHVMKTEIYQGPPAQVNTHSMV